MSGWGLRRRIAVAMVTAGVLLVGIVGASVALLIQERDVQRHVIDQYYQGLRASQNYFVGLVDSETAIRGYALTHDTASLQPLRASMVPGNGAIVRVVARSIPEQKRALRLLADTDRAAALWYRQWAVPSMATIRAGGSLTPADVRRGMVRFDQVRADYDGYIDAARLGRQQAADQLQQLTSLLFAAVLATALIAVATGGALWFALVRWVSRPVARLGREVREVSDGALEHPVVTQGAPELVQLGNDVERMRVSLVQQLAEVEAGREELQAARDRLEHQTADLARSNRDLEQFAYVASHDLQEPLRKVASFCQLLERRYAGQIDERADQYIHFAVDGAKRMQQLINDLLDFSRVGRQAAPMSSVDLDDCLHQTLAGLEATIRGSGATVTADALPPVRGERGLLVQLLSNLVGNAIKFRSEQPPQVHVEVRQAGPDSWEFSCRDNGIGIDAAYADRVFMIFQRLHPKDVYPGTGIGLALCKRIVEYHGGRIWIEDNGPAATGTTVRWTMPALPVGRNGQPVRAVPSSQGVR